MKTNHILIADSRNLLTFWNPRLVAISIGVNPNLSLGFLFLIFSMIFINNHNKYNVMLLLIYQSVRCDVFYLARTHFALWDISPHALRTHMCFLPEYPPHPHSHFKIIYLYAICISFYSFQQEEHFALSNST